MYKVFLISFLSFFITTISTTAFEDSHTNNTTGTLDLNVSVEIDADSALINLN